MDRQSSHARRIADYAMRRAGHGRIGDLPKVMREELERVAFAHKNDGDGSIAEAVIDRLLTLRADPVLLPPQPAAKMCHVCGSRIDP